MKNRLLKSLRLRRAGVALLVALIVCSSLLSSQARAASWNNIEPLKSRRADVERILGRPINEQPGATGPLRFKVMGGTVTVTFVTARFIANKKLNPELEGTVLEIVLQHEHSTDTPESMNLSRNSDFKRQDEQGGIIFLNQKDGITYTFVGGQLKTSRYSPAAELLAHSRKG